MNQSAYAKLSGLQPLGNKPQKYFLLARPAIAILYTTLLGREKFRALSSRASKIF